MATITGYYLGQECQVEVEAIDGGWLKCHYPEREKKGKVEWRLHWVTQVFTEPWGDEYVVTNAEAIHHLNQVDAEGRLMYPAATNA